MIRIVLLVGVWCALWGDLSFANVVDGIIIALAVSALGPLVSGRLRLVPLMKISWLTLHDMVVSTFVVAAEVLTPGSKTEGFFEIELPEEARPHVFMLTVLVTLTPGTAVARVEQETNTLEVFTFDMDHAEEIRDHTLRLAQYAIDGFPVVTERPPGWRWRWTR